MREKAPADTSFFSGSPSEVFITFFKLGLTSFGGPIAHLGYFRLELVEKRKWVSENQFGQLLAICQFLPGPASSQLGFSLGLQRAGWLGALAAFVAFTVPSAVLLVVFAAILPSLSGTIGSAAVHGLKLVALAVVAQGVLGMSRQLCPDVQRITIATLAAVVVLVMGSASAQLLVVVGGAIAGVVFCRSVQPNAEESLSLNYGPRVGWILLALFALFLFGLPLLATERTGLLEVADAFYRAGALVFGGGHVVLPLLEESVVTSGWISQDKFLAGYGAAQAVPGPMFTFAAYLGTVLPGSQGGVAGAVTALLCVFLPGFLLIAGALPLWRLISGGAVSARAIAGVNAAVVGLLGAALYDPIFVSGVRGPIDAAIGIVALMLLVAWRLSPLLVVVWCVTSSVATALLV